MISRAQVSLVQEVKPGEVLIVKNEEGVAKIVIYPGTEEFHKIYGGECVRGMRGKKPRGLMDRRNCIKTETYDPLASGLDFAAKFESRPGIYVPVLKNNDQVCIDYNKQIIFLDSAGDPPVVLPIDIAAKYAWAPDSVKLRSTKITLEFFLSLTTDRQEKKSFELRTLAKNDLSLKEKKEIIGKIFYEQLKLQLSKPYKREDCQFENCGHFWSALSGVPFRKFNLFCRMVDGRCVWRCPLSLIYKEGRLRDVIPPDAKEINPGIFSVIRKLSGHQLSKLIIFTLNKSEDGRFEPSAALIEFSQVEKQDPIYPLYQELMREKKHDPSLEVLGYVRQPPLNPPIKTREESSQL